MTINETKTVACKQIFDLYKSYGRTTTMQHIEDVYEIWQKLKEKGITNVAWMRSDVDPGKSSSVDTQYYYNINGFKQFFNDCWKSYILRAIERQNLVNPE